MNGHGARPAAKRNETHMFTSGSPDGYREVIEKIRMKTTVYGAHTLMVEFRLKAGADLPAHLRIF